MGDCSGIDDKALQSLGTPAVAEAGCPRAVCLPELFAAVQEFIDLLASFHTAGHECFPGDRIFVQLRSRLLRKKI